MREGIVIWRRIWGLRMVMGRRTRRSICTRMVGRRRRKMVIEGVG